MPTHDRPERFGWEAGELDYRPRQEGEALTRPWEAEFIRRWQAGETTDRIAAALGIAEGTARSRAFTLQREGKIPPRPRGGRRAPRVGAPSAPPGAPPPTPAAPAPAVPMGALSAEDLALWQELKTHWPALKALLTSTGAPGAPIGAPQRTRKRGFVVAESMIALIARYAQAAHCDQKDVLHTALVEFFDRRGWLTAEGPAGPEARPSPLTTGGL